MWITGENDMKKITLFVSFFLFTLAIISTSAQAAEINPFVFLDQFPEIAHDFGFPKERDGRKWAFAFRLIHAP
jgi:hypothetical protein